MGNRGLERLENNTGYLKYSPLTLIWEVSADKGFHRKVMTQLEQTIQISRMLGLKVWQFSKVRTNLTRCRRDLCCFIKSRLVKII